MSDNRKNQKNQEQQPGEPTTHDNHEDQGNDNQTNNNQGNRWLSGSLQALLQYSSSEHLLDLWSSVGRKWTGMNSFIRYVILPLMCVSFPCTMVGIMIFLGTMLFLGTLLSQEIMIQDLNKKSAKLGSMVSKSEKKIEAYRLKVDQKDKEIDQKDLKHAEQIRIYAEQMRICKAKIEKLEKVDQIDQELDRKNKEINQKDLNIAEKTKIHADQMEINKLSIVKVEKPEIVDQKDHGIGHSVNTKRRHTCLRRMLQTVKSQNARLDALCEGQKALHESLVNTNGMLDVEISKSLRRQKESNELHSNIERCNIAR